MLNNAKMATDNEIMARWMRFFAYLIIVMLALMLFGCGTTKYVQVITVERDTTYITKERRDSIFKHDSIYVHEWSKDDTIFVEVSKWLKEYVEVEKTDTFYQTKTDSIPYPVKVVKEVPRDYTWWDKTRFYISYAAMALLVIVTLKFLSLAKKP